MKVDEVHEFPKCGNKSSVIDCSRFLQATGGVVLLDTIPRNAKGTGTDSQQHFFIGQVNGTLFTYLHAAEQQYTNKCTWTESRVLIGHKRATDESLFVLARDHQFQNNLILLPNSNIYK